MLKTLPDASVQCCVTSPPYYGLRDYGVDGQIGLEQSPDEYVAQLVVVFREVRRVLRDDGVLWLNLGDSYAGGGRARGKDGKVYAPDKQMSNAGSFVPPTPVPEGLKPKDLLGIPWMVAFALRADGWYLRSAVVWHKPNPMPESVTDRPTSAYESVFLLTKSARYFYDAEAIKEVGTIPAGTRAAKGSNVRSELKDVNSRPPEYWEYDGTRNARNVWTIATQPYAEAHFATFPPELAERCIKSGSSERGACPTCCAPWARKTQRIDQGWDGSRYGERAVEATGGATSGGTARSTLGSSNGKLTGKTVGLGFIPTCACRVECPACEGGGLGGTQYSPSAPGGVVEACCEPCDGRGTVIPDPGPCAILDPFGGAGTVGLVADRLGRDAILIELNPGYAAMATSRVCRDAGLFAEVSA